MQATLRTITVGLLLSLPSLNAQVFNDFEAGTAGSSYGFRVPSLSGSTSANIATDPASTMTVVEGFDANSTKVGQFQFNFVDDTTTRWVRLTTSGATGVPNPLVDLNQVLQFDIYSVNAIKLAVGIRETGGTGPVGANGGSSGTGIEWIGAEQATSSVGVPPGGMTITGGSWQTVTIDFNTAPVFAFTGNGALAGDWGVLENLAVSSLGNASQTIYVDNFRIVPVPEPGTTALAALGGLLLSACWFWRRR